MHFRQDTLNHLTWFRWLFFGETRGKVAGWPGTAGNREKGDAVADPIFVNTIKDRDAIKARFLVHHKTIPLNKNGKPYLALVLMDRTGTIEARVWENVDTVAPTFEVGDFVELDGMALAYQGKVQLKVHTIRPVPASAVHPEDYLPCSSKDKKAMLDRLRALLSSIQLAPLRELLLDRLDDEAFAAAFTRAPAAKSIHHAMLSGLLEHTLSACELADRIAALYPHLERDLLLAGAFLHDVGKTRELASETGFDYTDEGRLVGHIVLGAMMFGQWAAARPDLPAGVALKITHMILSHHGSYEFGSPKRPKFAEAMVLNFIDELDSKIETYHELALREGGQKWSSFQKLFDRFILLGTPEPAGEDQSASAPAADKPADDSPPRTRRGRETPLTQQPFSQLNASLKPEARPVAPATRNQLGFFASSQPPQSPDDADLPEI